MACHEDAVPFYLERLIDDLAGRDDPALDPFVAELRAVETQGARRGPFPRLDHPAMIHLQAVLGECPPDVAAAAEALDWRQVYAGAGIDPVLAEGMLAAQLAGTYGRFPSERISTGLFLIAPHVHYPLHTHDAAEIYFCRAGEIEVQHGLTGAPATIGPGACSITPPNRLHALQTGERPALVAYVWIGDLRCRNWWWSQASGGAWQRTAWKRGEGEAWRVLDIEPVTPAVLAEAHAGLAQEEERERRNKSFLARSEC